MDPDPSRYGAPVVRVPAKPAAPPPLTGQRSADTLADYFREAYGLTGGQASQLSYIRRGAVYACVTLRADMLCALPLKAYRLGSGSGRGKRVDVRNPYARRGMPIMARGMRIADAGTVTEVEGSEIVRRLARPNEDWTQRQLVKMTETSLGLAGQAYWRMHGRGTKATAPPQEISYLRHDRMRPDKAAPNDPTARTIKGWVLDDGTADRAELQKGEALWLRYPDPEDPDFGVLAPADVARLGADSYHDAMRSNRDMFTRGLTPAGFITPPEGQDFFSPDQVAELDRDIGRKWSDPSNRHRMSILRYRFGVESLASMSPKDAEFVALMSFAIEDAARTYRVPIEFIGGTRRTYQNMDAAFKGIWMMALEPEATWLSDEFSARLAPMFGDNVDFVALDLGDVVALQEDEKSKWGMQREKIEAHVLTGNEYRESEGMEPLETVGASIEVGKVIAISGLATDVSLGRMAPESAKAIITGAIGLSQDAADAIIDPASEFAPPEPTPEPPPADVPPPVPVATEPPPPEPARAMQRGGPAFGSDEHQRLMTRSNDAQAPHRKRVADVATKLYEAQRASILARLGVAGRANSRMGVADLTAAFQKPRWVREFREAMKPALAPAVEDAAAGLFDDVGAKGELDMGSPEVINFLRARSQRFATEVNETTWAKLKASFEQGIEAGETMRELAARVAETMDGRIASSPENVARTEVLGAFSGGSQLAAEATGLDLEKTWLSALDSRVRPDHEDAHGQTVGLDEDFEVGGDTGPGPGMMGSPENDCQCRCTTTYGEKNARSLGVAQEAENAAVS